MAAFIACEPNRPVAVASALTVMGVAGEIAAERSSGPGTFAANILDALYRLSRPDLAVRMEKA